MGVYNGYISIRDVSTRIRFVNSIEMLDCMKRKR